MGVIKDGKVSGNLPSNEVFAVHYPGYPSSTSRAIQTLGGSEAILKVQTNYTYEIFPIFVVINVVQAYFMCQYCSCSCNDMGSVDVE